MSIIFVVSPRLRILLVQRTRDIQIQAWVTFVTAPRWNLNITSAQHECFSQAWGHE
jgi:hypothetical protein